MCHIVTYIVLLQLVLKEYVMTLLQELITTNIEKYILIIPILYCNSWSAPLKKFCFKIKQNVKSPIKQLYAMPSKKWNEIRITQNYTNYENTIHAIFQILNFTYKTYSVYLAKYTFSYNVICFSGGKHSVPHILALKFTIPILFLFAYIFTFNNRSDIAVFVQSMRHISQYLNHFSKLKKQFSQPFHIQIPIKLPKRLIHISNQLILP